LQGLALDIPYYNEDIIEIAVTMGSIDANPCEKMQQRVDQNYWLFMANIIQTILTKNTFRRTV
jgi:hypothetical protein